jgi:hypothetical protein
LLTPTFAYTTFDLYKKAPHPDPVECKGEREISFVSNSFYPLLLRCVPGLFVRVFGEEDEGAPRLSLEKETCFRAQRQAKCNHLLVSSTREKEKGKGSKCQDQDQDQGQDQENPRFWHSCRLCRGRLRRWLWWWLWSLIKPSFIFYFILFFKKKCIFVGVSLVELTKFRVWFCFDF